MSQRRELLLGSGPLDVVVTLGTDHHPFARLVDWIDQWVADTPGATAIVQHGTAPAPRHAEGHALLDPAAIPALMARAGVVVGHAGPGTVLDARSAGRLPVIVPRLARLGEVVDDHQVTFSRWMHDRGQAICVTDEFDLRTRIAEALAEPAAYAVASGTEAPPPAVTLFGDLVDGMLSGRAR